MASPRRWPPFAPVHLAVWAAFFAVRVGSQAAWWVPSAVLPDAAVETALGALLAAGLWFGGLRRAPLTAGGAARGLATAAALGVVWTFAHQALVLVLFSPDSLAGFVRFGLLKVLGAVPFHAAVLVGYAAAGLAARHARGRTAATAAARAAADEVGALRRALDDARSDGLPVVAPAPERRFLVRRTGRLASVPADAVRWVEAEGDYVRLHTADGRSHLLRETMGAFAARLDPARFVRIHRSTIVAAGALREVRRLPHGDALAVLDDGTERRVGRAYRAALEGWMGGAPGPAGDGPATGDGAARRSSPGGGVRRSGAG